MRGNRHKEFFPKLFPHKGNQILEQVAQKSLCSLCPQIVFKSQLLKTTRNLIQPCLEQDVGPKTSRDPLRPELFYDSTAFT